MLSKEIQRVFSKIAGMSGIKAKSEYLKNYMEDLEMVEVLKMTFSPYITFGLGSKTVDSIYELSLTASSANQSNFSDETWDLLEKLANRELSGQEAQKAVLEEMEALNHDSALLLCSVLKKNPNMGITGTGINKLKKGTIPEYKVALAKKFADAKALKFPMAVEVKLDGMRVIAEARFSNDLSDFSDIVYRSREGHEISSLGNLDDMVNELAGRLAEEDPALFEEGVFIDGEVTVDGNYNTTMKQIKKKDHTVEAPVFTVFWWQSLKAFEDGKTVPTTYKQARNILKKCMRNPKMQKNDAVLELVDSYIVSSEAEVHRIYGNARSQGLEGVIVKTIDGPYEYKRTAHWLKIKDKQTLDLEMVDVEEGTGKYVNMLGKIIVDYNGVRVGVGSGLTDQQRKEIWDDPDAFIDSIVEVSFQEVTPDGSLRHPVFEGFRIDKSESDSVKKTEAA